MNSALRRRRHCPLPTAVLATLLVILPLISTSAIAQSTDNSATPASPASGHPYSAVKALLRERCFACHGSLKQEAQLRLDTVAAMQTGGSSGPAINPGNALASHLFQRVSSSDPDTRMPPEGRPLESAQLQLLETWLNAGAVPTVDDQPEPDPRAHWSFQPPARQPGVNDIDSFVSSRLAAAGLQPLPAADKPTLLRRAYLDLIGLPPTPQELSDFLNDPAPEAFAKTDRKSTRLNSSHT